MEFLEENFLRSLSAQENFESKIPIFREEPADSLPVLGKLRNKQLENIQQEYATAKEKNIQYIQQITEFDAKLRGLTEEIEMLEMEVRVAKAQRDEIIGEQYLKENQRNEGGRPVSEYNALKASRDNMKLKLGELETSYAQTIIDLEEAMKSYKTTKNLLDMRDKEIANMRLEVDKLRRQRDALSSRAGNTSLRRGGSDVSSLRRYQSNGIGKDAISPFRITPFNMAGESKSAVQINRSIARPAYVRRTEEDSKSATSKSNIIG